MASDTGLLATAKRILNISDTSFDEDLSDFLSYAVKNLSPIALADLDPDETVAVASGDTDFELPAGIFQVRWLYLPSSEGFTRCKDFKQHGAKIYLDGPVDYAGNIRIFGLGKYTVEGLESLPEEFELPVVYWLVSIFYSEMAGKNSKYNMYVGNIGSVSDRDMKDSAQYYNDLANETLMDRVGLRGA